jgi:hypothetical protein
MNFSVIYTSDAKPDMTGDKDIAAHDQLLDSGTLGLVNPNGSVCRCVDFAPKDPESKEVPLMHRTQSLDYGIVVSGEIELLLPGQIPRLMKPGDVAVQRATMHAWRNPSETQAARMIFVLLAAEEVDVGNGLKLGESLPHIEALGEGGVAKALKAKRV